MDQRSASSPSFAGQPWQRHTGRASARAGAKSARHQKPASFSSSATSELEEEQHPALAARTQGAIAEPCRSSLELAPAFSNWRNPKRPQLPRQSKRGKEFGELCGPRAEPASRQSGLTSAAVQRSVISFQALASLQQPPHPKGYTICWT